jgi:hypothetical protein
MQILFINNDGAGFADQIEIAPGTSINQLFTDRIPHGKPQDYLIRVNRQATTADYVLQEGDRVSMTPTKIEGAIHIPNRDFPVTEGNLWERDNASTACTLSDS